MRSIATRHFERLVRHPSSVASALRTVAAQMLDRDRVVPRDVVRRNAQGGGEALALGRTGRVVAAYHGLNPFRVQSRGGDECANSDSGFFHQAGYRLHDCRNLITVGRRKRLPHLLFWDILDKVWTARLWEIGDPGPPIGPPIRTRPIP